MNSISIVIPTLNSEKVLYECLKSIDGQDYPKEKIEVIIVDGGSTDRTLEIAKRFNVNKILENPKKTGEAGKAVGVKETKGEVVAFIDSDNILDGNDWFRRMIEPFSEIDVCASEPLFYSYRKKDGYITRYMSLLGMNDPLCLFFGNYDRMSQLTGKWTEMPVEEEDRGNYIKVKLNRENLPTIGANGFLIRKDVISKCNIGDYLFDIDLLLDILNIDRNMPVEVSQMKIAKVKIGIVHIFAGDIWKFIKKQSRRIADFNYFSRLNTRKYQWKNLNRTIKLFKFIIYTVLVFPLVYQSISGYIKKKDLAWFFHPIACLITLIVYSWYTIKLIFFKPEMLKRR